ncbi:MAG: aldo/keto reductase [Oligoflexia bacterium]|nr:aldo/keto reductase [Oligoflexia bacterium]
MDYATHFATIPGTSEYFRSRSLGHSLGTAPVALGRTGLFVSPVGFGGYRVDEEDPTHSSALELALLSGCNLIDTSSNYTDGGSERLIGFLLKKLIEEKKIRREEVVIVTKAGYVQGKNMELVRERESAGHPFPDMVKYTEDCWHCISPDFLEDQITRSLARLGLKTVDFLLLHNPEYFLKTDANHSEYYARIRRAFEHLEKECARGRVRGYGISSNTFPVSKEDPEYTSLESVISLAEEISSDHHFQVIEFPLNLFEPGAVFEENNSGKTVAALAREKGLGTLINRPLNSFHEQTLVRLADFPPHDDEDIVGNLKESWSLAMELEQEYPKITGSEPIPASRLAWGHIIRAHFERLSEIDAWKQTLRWQIGPSLENSLTALTRDSAFHAWIKEYRAATSRLFTAITAYLENQASFRSDRIAALLDHAYPPIQTSQTLSRKVIRLYRSIPGIDCILVGMRRPEYVKDVLALEPPIPESAARKAWMIAAEKGMESGDSETAH